MSYLLNALAEEIKRCLSDRDVFIPNCLMHGGEVLNRLVLNDFIESDRRRLDKHLLQNQESG